VINSPAPKRENTSEIPIRKRKIISIGSGKILSATKEM